MSSSSKRKLRESVNKSATTSRKTTKKNVKPQKAKASYTCEYCGKIFTHKLPSVNHMNKCKEIVNDTVVNENILGVNNNEMNQEGNTNTNTRTGSFTNPTDNRQITTNKDTSIYDYNEPDDILDDKELKENSKEISSNKRCKHCDTTFDNPLDLLRHTRDCHNFPRTILPPEEIEKYFDYPNRQFCPICEKPIKTRNFRSVFIKHLMVHTTGLTHQCRICKKKFRRRDHMRAHEKRHIVSG